jgi:hypothetical protein
LHAAGRRDEAKALFADAEWRQGEVQPDYPLLYSFRGYRYCEQLLDYSEWEAVRQRAERTLQWATANQTSLLNIALDELSFGRAALGLELSDHGTADNVAARGHLDRAVAGMRAAEQNCYIPICLLARAALRRALGDWDGAARDLDEVEEIARPGPMRLHLCDMALERTRLVLGGARHLRHSTGFSMTARQSRSRRAPLSATSCMPRPRSSCASPPTTSRAAAITAATRNSPNCKRYCAASASSPASRPASDASDQISPPLARA